MPRPNSYYCRSWLFATILVVCASSLVSICYESDFGALPERFSELAPLRPGRRKLWKTGVRCFLRSCLRSHLISGPDQSSISPDLPEQRRDCRSFKRENRRVNRLVGMYPSGKIQLHPDPARKVQGSFLFSWTSGIDRAEVDVHATHRLGANGHVPVSESWLRIT
jgi:hypothetical protein